VDYCSPGEGPDWFRLDSGCHSKDANITAGIILEKFGKIRLPLQRQPKGSPARKSPRNSVKEAGKCLDYLPWKRLSRFVNFLDKND
jgi:hypothetical protein